MVMEIVRKASHAGSLYNDDGMELSEELETWLALSDVTKSPDVRGIIAPHGAYYYSGQAAAYAFGNIDPSNITRVFLLGPSHFYDTGKCALSSATVYQTPIGDLLVDIDVNEELKATGKFEVMSMSVDEEEHSLEMHLPYVAKVFEGRQIKIVPILVGDLSAKKEFTYGQILSKYLNDPNNFFCVSTDFCHWGSRYKYANYDKRKGPIYKSIEALDKKGMEIIESSDPVAFKQYLFKYGNTICGCHAITVFLHMLRKSSTNIKIEFLCYQQSYKCESPKNFSVSYASAAAKIDAKNLSEEFTFFDWPFNSFTIFTLYSIYLQL